MLRHRLILSVHVCFADKLDEEYGRQKGIRDFSKVVDLSSEGDYGPKWGRQVSSGLRSFTVDTPVRHLSRGGSAMGAGIQGAIWVESQMRESWACRQNISS